jgi:hypothetical protein
VNADLAVGSTAASVGRRPGPPNPSVGDDGLAGGRDFHLSKSKCRRVNLTCRVYVYGTPENGEEYRGFVDVDTSAKRLHRAESLPVAGVGWFAAAWPILPEPIRRAMFTLIGSPPKVTRLIGACRWQTNSQGILGREARSWPRGSWNGGDSS